MPTGSAAQVIPSDVTVQALVKPEGPRLRLLVRVSLSAMRDMEFPTYGIGYLDFERAEPTLRSAARQRIADALAFYENGELLDAPRIAAVRVSLPSDRSFATYEAALAHVASPPLPNDTQLYWEQGVLDVLVEYPIRSDESAFAIDPSLERPNSRVLTELRYLSPGGARRAFEYAGNPGLIWLDPSWHQAAGRFIELGFALMLERLDHLLFLVCLVVPFRRLRPIVLLVTSFAVAHSVTLIASAFPLEPNALWFPSLVGTLVAASVLYMAFENVVGPKLDPRWMMTFSFGLVHGFGFSLALQPSLQFAGAHLFTSRLAFNVGIELGQLAVLALLLPALAVLFRYLTDRVGVILISVFVAHTAWHWMMERLEILGQFQFQRPVFDAIFLASAMRWAMLLLLAGGLIWAGRVWLDQLAPQPAGGEAATDDRA